MIGYAGRAGTKENKVNKARRIKIPLKGCNADEGTVLDERGRSADSF